MLYAATASRRRSLIGRSFTPVVLILALTLLGPPAFARAPDQVVEPGTGTSPSRVATSDACVLSAGPDSTREHEGLTDYGVHLRPDGTLKAVMLFVDFADAEADDEPSAYFDRLSEAADWLDAASFGRTSLDIDPVLEWFRMPDASTDYGMQRNLTFEAHRAYLADAVEVADDDVDFSGYELLYVVSPETATAIDASPAFVGTAANGIGARDDDPDADGNVLRFGANIGNNVYQRPLDLQYRVLVHETGHTFGLPDLYAYSGALHRFVGDWDLMGHDQGNAPDLLAWHKRKLDWLDAGRLVCIDEDGASEHTLTPVETAGGTKAIVVPTGEHTVYVAEVRARTGVDTDACAEGVLIYEVDSNTPSGEGPVLVRTPDGLAPVNGCAAVPETFNDNGDDDFYDPDAGIAFEIVDASDDDQTVRVTTGIEPEPPVADAGGPYVTQEGDAIELDASASNDPNPGDELTFEWDTDGDGDFTDPGGFSRGARIRFGAVARDGAFDVAVRVTDLSGASDVDQTTVTVENVAPRLEFDMPERADEGDEIVFTGRATDAGWFDPLDVTVEWGPGGGTQLVLGDTRNTPTEASRFFEAHHVYGDDGTFPVEVCARDDDEETCVTESIDVGNIAPTAAIEAAGPVLVVDAGEDTRFTSRSTDPGSDDLELVWDFGDGTDPASRTDLVNPPLPDGSPSASVEPRDVSDTVTHRFAEVCAREVTFAVTDDDAGTASDSIPVIVTGSADRTRSAGYWTHQARGNGRTDLEPESLECHLAAVGLASRLFHNVRDASTADTAYDVLKPESRDMRLLFDRQALAAWLNFASGAVALDQPVDTDGDGTTDVTFAEALEAAEDVRLDPSSSTAELERHKDILEGINHSR